MEQESFEVPQAFDLNAVKGSIDWIDSWIEELVKNVNRRKQTMALLDKEQQKILQRCKNLVAKHKKATIESIEEKRQQKIIEEEFSQAKREHARVVGLLRTEGDSVTTLLETLNAISWEELDIFTPTILSELGEGRPRLEV